ncbi:protein serine/threonine kinase, putative [Entamoeba invadens IP1]|uniref:Protein serine/threonine kinase, putative n=1 Tax=Entamoeba invadens IP1 TaxID=370355 RepID=L7FNZ1_ENTIV|nr:protein serine/threonine kinase, putative [Entamoeba invadens IP1]ELP92541.1 protein serine/threonine kinase, putative [Entamoeba invadens IP1]|eukprot:XP_004259312.1 protein serine/threonine kinase, putative [Entamoeba invadens IP1]
MQRKSYKITVSPKVVTLRPKDTCLFTIEISPTYSGDFKSSLTLSWVFLKRGVELTKRIPLIFSTALSTWIDDSSITDMIEICRGCVGIIFKATYKGRTVAVKKIRQFKNVKDDEFTTEVDMLQKIRNPNIPGNILVVELNSIIEVNAKLSDFGSARNVNLLMSNLTFTKDVGTPKYMAPELLNGQKYSIAADVYSLGITFFEAFTWKDAFENVKYFFEIPELISKGKRPDDKCLSYKERRLLEEMWAQKRKERITSEEVVDVMQKMFDRVNN